VGGSPAGEEPDRVVGGRTRVGAERDQGQARVRSQFHHLIGQVQVADHGMPDVLEARAVQLHIMGTPADAELVATG
jgi:hypothetical protein